jgi:hypothetical protein
MKSYKIDCSATTGGLVLDAVPGKRGDDLIEEEEDYLDVTSVTTTEPRSATSCLSSLSQKLGMSLCEDLRFAIVVVSVMSMSVGKISCLRPML